MSTTEEVIVGGWTQARVLEAMDAFAAEHGRLPYTKEWACSGPGYPSHTIVGKLFGSWLAALIAAGISDGDLHARVGTRRDTYGPQYGRAGLLEAIKEFHAEHGCAPSERTWNAWRARNPDRVPSRGSFTYHFGGLRSAVAEAGLAPAPESGGQAVHTILDAIRRWDITYGSPPTHAAWDRPALVEAQDREALARYDDQGPWPQPLHVHAMFGDFDAAAMAAGLARRPGAGRPRHTPDTVLELIVAWKELYGRWPRRKDWDPGRARTTSAPDHASETIARYQAGGWPHADTVRSHFGSFSAAVDAAAAQQA